MPCVHFWAGRASFEVCATPVEGKRANCRAEKHSGSVALSLRHDLMFSARAAYTVQIDATA